MRHQAVLLIGPTGSGKSPFGDWLQFHGLWSRACHHFDFGACLRQIAAGPASDFTEDEIGYLRDVVAQGALLENRTFYLAARILEDYVRSRHVLNGDLLVMNGLPRHVGQAEDLEAHLEFLAVFSLQCSAETVWERLQRNTGGDRLLRADDTRELVAHKLEIFQRRTEPLLAYYRKLGVPVVALDVGPLTQPQDLIPLAEEVRRRP